MKNTESYIRFYKKVIFLFPLFALIIGVSYFFAMKDGFNYAIGHFDSTVWFYLLAASVILSALWAGFCAVFSRRTALDDTVPLSPLSVFASIVAAVASFYLFGHILGKVFSHDALSKLELISNLLVVFIGIAVLLSLFKKTKSSVIETIILLLAAIALNLEIFVRYFDFSVPVNSPVRHLSTVLMSALLLFFISEARFSLGKKSGRLSSPFFVFTSCASASIALGLSAGALVFRLVCPTEGDPNLSVAQLVLYFALSLIAVDRVIAGATLFVDKKPASEPASPDDSNNI